ncbi:hypothetical protein, partial [Amycolatopsis sp. NPDC050768]|uniref:hypothetical protein n=1 Tax=Amycolatopsis sp. NPDC050768 TaxID=3154839 RepID=UPI0034081404
ITITQLQRRGHVHDCDSLNTTDVNQSTTRNTSHVARKRQSGEFDAMTTATFKQGVRDALAQAHGLIELSSRHARTK